MPKLYKIKLSGAKTDQDEFELQTGQRWLITLSDYRKITKITPKQSTKDLTISYIEKTSDVETEGKESLEKFIMWIIEKEAEKLVVSYEVE